MTTDEKIGQLFMVAAYSNRGEEHLNELKTLVRESKIGGLIFFQGGPVRQAKMTNSLQSESDIPLWIGMDAEWGLGMRLDSTISYPRQMTLGAIENDTLIYEMGAEIARQCRRLGVHINFAPVVDVNNNPENPVINSRSFGENKLWVTKKAKAYMRGMQENGVLANAKHFPGHGDTDTDSHHDLPIINHSKERLEQIELYPYRKLFDEGLSSVMVAHLSIPALDSTDNRASTLSPEIVTDLLKEEYEFQGLIFTDALNMKGVSKYFQPGELDALAAIAGNDVLLFPEDVPAAIKSIRGAIQKGKYSIKTLNESVYKILRAKEWLGLPYAEEISIENLVSDLNKSHSRFLNQELSDAAITVIQNTKDIVPIRRLGKKSFGVVTIGGKGDDFKKVLSIPIEFKEVELPSAPDLAQGKIALDAMKDLSTVIIYVENTNNRPSKNFGLSKEAVEFAEAMAVEHEVILVFMGSPYALQALENPDRFQAILIGYQDNASLARAAASVLCGSIPATGKLPVSIGDHYPVQTGLSLARQERLYYGSPLQFGLKASDFNAIDSIVYDGIEKRAFPGAQVLVAKDGVVVYNKSFGYHTYENQRPVREDDIYDLASITKILATTISLMKLQDEGKFDLDKPVGEYLDNIPDTSRYHNITPRKMLAHVAGLRAWIPFYKETLVEGMPDWRIYSQSASELYTREVARNMWINEEVSDSLLTKILQTPLRKNTDYKYSDLGYYFMKEIIKKQSGFSVDTFASRSFYEPMGLEQTGYLPLKRFDKDQITPTEYDTYFRKQLVHGYVHDPGAAMLGGVGGHAGLFSNAMDVAALMQMLLNKGVYGGERYLSEEVVEEYTRCQYCKDENDENRRGAGFDKPVIPDGPGPTCKCVSFDSFGHSGFTGTIAWADPTENIIYVFLSNRVYPSAENNKLAKMNIRTLIQEEIYRVLAPQELEGILGYQLD
jgi:beta-glucosidase-like glycosyl hydrolase/CubicO group peptidase (beta-lactamase class C family)